MDDLDRIEDNFRLSLICQRETNLNLKQVASSLRSFGDKFEEFAREVKQEFNSLATQVDTVAEKAQENAERLEDSIEVMKSFAESQVEIRKTLADCIRRLDALEGKRAS
ncbi:MAG: hypothetical protein HY319_00735 [Armatimonadetes bacterium]|nr:hypothetical protein [Armatimonadota bacterium]